MDTDTGPDSALSSSREATTRRAVTVPLWAESGDRVPLLVDGREATRVWVARRRKERRKGLLGTDGIDGGLWITRCNSVHCVGMRHTIDVVYVTRRGQVVAVRTMRPGSVGLPRLRASATLELPDGGAQALGIRPGSRVELGDAATTTPAQ